MATRNFWLEAFVDGRKSDVTGGPQAKDGGMAINLYVRHKGSSVRALRLDCLAGVDGKLFILVDTGRDSTMLIPLVEVDRETLPDVQLSSSDGVSRLTARLVSER